MQPEHSNDLDQRLSRLYAASVPESYETGWRADIRREESISRMNKPNRNRIWKRLVPALCAFVLVAGGLWAGTLDQNLMPADRMAATMVTSQRSASGGTNQMAAKYSLMAAEETAYDTAASYDMGASVVTYGAVPQTDRKLVRTADLTIRTETFDDSLAAVQEKLQTMGGYIENLYQYGEDVRRIHLSMRVPSEKLDEFLTGLTDVGRVTDRSESTTDMTVQYADNAARLQTLYDKRDRLNELLLKAENVSDLIEIESAIADTQYQIDSYESSQRSIDRQVDMSAVNLTLAEQQRTPDNPELTLGQRMAAGLKESVEWLGEFAQDVMVFAVMIAPVAVPAALVWLLWRIIRRWRSAK